MLNGLKAEALMVTLVFFSCATGVRVRDTPPPEYVPEAAEVAESGDTAERPEVALVPFESVTERIKLNSSEIKKYVELDDAGGIIVKGSIDGAVVVYDLENAVPDDDAACLLVGFTARRDDGAVLDSGTLRWDMTVSSDAAFPAGVLLAFDDDHFASWEKFFPLFDRYDARVTFFAQGDYTPFWERASEKGHEMGYHSLNHVDLRNVDEKTLAAEVFEPLEVFKKQGFAPEAFAYPFGFSSAALNCRLRERFRILRGFGVTFRLYDAEAVRGGYVAAKSIDNTTNKDDAAFYAGMTFMLRVVKFLGDGTFLPLATHEISDSALWGITPSRLEFLLETAYSLRLRFYRYGDFF
jgi:hypothetical protein